MTTERQISVVIPMYRSGRITASVVSSLNRCDLPPNTMLRIVVVDDASGDGSLTAVREAGQDNVTIIELPRNMGRSAARNRGLEEVHSGLILFLDSDCVPLDRSFLASHIAVLDQGAAVSMGTVDGASDGFWHAYQAEAARRRHRASALHGVALYGSSQNFMLSRQLFQSVGGFDEGYKGYGFEDRDLFLRIEAAGHKVEWARDARAIHRDKLELRGVCMKMAEAGGAPALRFHERHPQAYRTLGYGKLDSRHHLGLRLIEPLTTLAASLAVPFLESRLETEVIPLSWRVKVVRLVVAASYLRGTRHGSAQAFLTT